MKFWPEPFKNFEPRHVKEKVVLKLSVTFQDIGKWWNKLARKFK